MALFDSYPENFQPCIFEPIRAEPSTTQSESIFSMQNAVKSASLLAERDMHIDISIAHDPLSFVPYQFMPTVAIDSTAGEDLERSASIRDSWPDITPDVHFSEEQTNMEGLSSASPSRPSRKSVFATLGNRH